MILTLGLALTSSTTFGAEDCEKGGQIAKLQENLIAVTASQAVNTLDSRKSIAEISKSAPLGEAEQVAIEASKATVAITGVYKDGVKINDFGVSHHGSGYITPDGCFAVTVRHVPNQYDIRTDNGKSIFVPSPERPNGSIVEMEIGFAPGQLAQKASGTVIYSGASAVHADHDISLIRLGKKVNVNSIPIATAKDEQLVGVEMVSVGVPNSLQRRGFDLQAFADTSCHGIEDTIQKKQSLGGVPTSCKGSAGDSGGPLLAKVSINGKKVWRVVGLMAQVDSVNLNNISTQADASSTKVVRAFSINSYKRDLMDEMRDSLQARPCQ